MSPAITNLSSTSTADFDTCADTDLIAALLQNHDGAWRAFSRRYGRLIQACICRVTARFPGVVRPDDSAEICSMLYVQLLANDKMKLRSYSPERGSKLGTWLCLLATHTAFDFLRSVRRVPRHAELTEAEQLAAEVPDPADSSMYREELGRVGRALSGFTQKDREFVRLYFSEGLPPEEVAAQMGVSVKTVYSKKHKIQRRLESLLADHPLAA
jgi:RNA polymerase sigma-70 factor (ECF subfamily)